jgi:glycosyltransferase involved in cell wall biosynthesis
MARSVPVACSDIPALREVAGEAALYFDPRDREDIAAKVSELVTTPSLSQHLRHLGRARAAQFSWRSAAEGTLASYRRALAA